MEEECPITTTHNMEEAGPPTISSEPIQTNSSQVEDSQLIEVERKFIISNDCESKLIELGAKLNKIKTFNDTYYDTDDFTLTLADCWLRQRNGKWELKCPPKQRESDSTISQYAEYDCENDIVMITAPLLTYKPGNCPISLSCLIEETRCQGFATFRTERKSYALDEFTVDLDSTDFGFRVGEIEMIAIGGGHVAEAISKINELARKLGLTNTERIPGKMSAYLKRKNPDHYQRLLEKRVLIG